MIASSVPATVRSRCAAAICSKVGSNIKFPASSEAIRTAATGHSNSVTPASMTESDAPVTPYQPKSESPDDDMIVEII